MKSYIAQNKPDIQAALSNLIGKTVCVSWVCEQSKMSNGGTLRKNFEPQISVQDKLEGSIETGKFRVLVYDNTYTYFYDDSVGCVVHDVDEGKRPVIFIDN